MDFTKEHSHSHPKVIEEGDLVVVYERHDSLDHLFIKKGSILQNKFGTFPHDDMIGRPFGSKIQSRSSSGWIYILEPTPELWSIAVHTRTQIVNEIDSSIITLLLNIHPGCRVVESGTGSGCMTLALARAVYPTGKVFTFEYNSVRSEKAVEEFQRLKVDQLIQVRHHDVCGKYLNSEEAGFVGVEEDSVDAVFLDLPEPWLAISHAHKVLKPGKSICCYSPCMEQVMQTLEKLRELNFQSIRMLEVRQRPFDGRIIELETLDLGLSDEDRIENEKSTRDPELHHYHYQPKVRPVDLSGNASSNEAESVLKKRKLEENNSAEAVHSEQVDETLQDPASQIPSGLLRRIQNRPQSSVNGKYEMLCGRPVFTMKGHTAFLTFAIKSCSK